MSLSNNNPPKMVKSSHVLTHWNKMKQFAPQKECLDLGNNDENQEFNSTQRRKQELLGNSAVQRAI